MQSYHFTLSKMATSSETTFLLCYSNPTTSFKISHPVFIPASNFLRELHHDRPLFACFFLVIAKTTGVALFVPSLILSPFEFLANLLPHHTNNILTQSFQVPSHSRFSFLIPPHPPAHLLSPPSLECTCASILRHVQHIPYLQPPTQSRQESNWTKENIKKRAPHAKFNSGSAWAAVEPRGSTI